MAMTAEMVTRVIGLILAPAVLVTTCAILLNGLHSHYTAINGRLHLMARERLDMLRAVRSTADGLTAERLQEIDMQAPDLLRRHKLVHDAILVLYCAVMIFLASMFVIAAAAVTQWIGLAMAVLLTFLAAVATMLLSMLLITLEVRGSHRDVSYEMQRILRLSSQHQERRSQELEPGTQKI